MPRIVREADVSWNGNVARGEGRISAATSGAFSELPYSLATRVGAAEGKTSPEELLAAAHAACYAMSLASELSGAGSPPERLDVRCTITMDEVEGAGHRIVASSLDVRAAVADVDGPRFRELVEAADVGCPFSALVKASAEVTVRAAVVAR
jgi:osmotically inducible protein OsmC